MFSIGLIITTGILGGAVRSGSVGRDWHFWFAVTSIASSAVAYVVALRYILRNGYMMGLIRGDIAAIRSSAQRGEFAGQHGAELPLALRRPEDVKKPPQGFLWHRALLFLGVSAWLLYAYLEWWFRAPWNTWVPFAVLSAVAVSVSWYLKVRYPLPADVDF